ncbi:hypothetical protein ONZ45_g5072 [Pleurotus djamor]|nr:hypothetical protein ONZ45_g5072 [Pleurotus djamor]
MKRRTITIPPSPSSPFFVQALQYTPEPEYTGDDGLTLLLFHAMNLHKETFDVMVRSLLSKGTMNSGGGVKIRDVWTLDNPNHGLSASLNAHILDNEEWKDKWGAIYYAQAAYSLLSTTSYGLNFKTRNIVGIAHSAGATMLLQTLQPPIPFVAVVLMEPGLLPPTHPSSKSLPELFVKMALSKRSKWSSRSEAASDLRSKATYRAWNEDKDDVFDVPQRCALREVDASGTVSLACSPQQEAAHYKNPDIVLPPSEIFERIAKDDHVPIHLIEVRKDEYKGKSDAMKQYHIDVVSKTKSGSVRYMEKGGHLWPQTEPVLAAEVLISALAKIHPPGRPAKL